VNTLNFSSSLENFVIVTLEVCNDNVLNAIVVLAKCSKHLEVAKRQRIRDSFLGEDWV
jgi:hypothetical protein